MATTNQEVVDVFEWAEQLSENNQYFSVKTRKCRLEFIAFLENNNNFGVKKAPILNEGIETFLISSSDAARIRPNVELWLRSYGAGDDEKLKLLTERMSVLFPKTGGMFAKFTESNQKPSGPAWKLVDYLCFSLCKEITEMSDKELDALADNMNRELPLNSARMFSEFLMYAREKGTLSNGWIFSFNSRCESEPEGAYTAQEFLKMAYIIFNEEAWKKEDLLTKALKSEKAANLWLFTAMHFICGWRGTDIIRLPLPALPYGGTKMRTQLAEDRFDTADILSELEFRLRYVPLIPQKTKQHENIPELKLFVPESLRKPFGIILAVAASYHDATEPGGNFVRKDGDRSRIISFFGKDFLEACGEHGFSSRRANKAYLQGIEMMADSSPGKPKGYMLAALARSHKGGFGSLPETTDIYLRDAKFSGYRPDFIAREMFERGVFSFIPALMMEMYTQGSYTDLPVSAQTKFLAEIGIKASGLDGLTKTVDMALIKARTAIAAIMKHPEDIRGSVSDILQNIASGNAPGRQDGFLCLMTAAGFGCADSGRSSCIGCGYEIYTKTIIHSLSKEYARLVSLKKQSSVEESVRCTKILKEAIMPAITEIFAAIKRMYPDADIKNLINATEMGAMLC